MSVKRYGLGLTAALFAGSVAIAGAQTPPPSDTEKLETALSHLGAAQALIEDVLAVTTTVPPTTTTVPPTPTTAAPPATTTTTTTTTTTVPSGGTFEPLPLTIASVPDPISVWQPFFHPDAPGVKVRADVTNEVPAFSVLLDAHSQTLNADPLVNPGTPTHAHRFAGVVPTVLSPFEYWAQPGWETQRPHAVDGNGNIVAQTPGVWIPDITMNGEQVRLVSQIPVYYECSGRTVAPGRRAHMLPVGVGWVTQNHLWKTVGGKWRLNFFGPIGFHESIEPGPLSSPLENHDQLWFVDDGPLPPESEGWYATPQVEVYWKTRVDASVNLPELVMYGGDATVTPHMDYVSGSTPVGDTFAAQIMIDWACNQPEGRHSLHAVRLDP